MAAEAFDSHLWGTVERALDLGHGRDCEAAVRASGASGPGIQSDQARAPLARVPLLFSSGHSNGTGSGSAAWESDCLAICATGSMGLAGPASAPAMAAAVARRCELGDRAHAAGSRATPVAVSLQTAAKSQREEAHRPHCKPAGLASGRRRLARRNE